MNPLPSDAIPTLTDILHPGQPLTIPTLTEVLARPPGVTRDPESVDLMAVMTTPDATHTTPPSQSSEAASLGGIQREALESRLLEHLSHRFQAALETRVHTSVAPAVSMLADRIAYKAAQEVAADLAERMQDDLRLAIRQALDELQHPGSSQ
jgi:hypothetical protein